MQKGSNNDFIIPLTCKQVNHLLSQHSVHDICSINDKQITFISLYAYIQEFQMKEDGVCLLLNDSTSQVAGIYKQKKGISDLNQFYYYQFLCQVKFQKQ